MPEEKNLIEDADQEKSRVAGKNEESDEKKKTGKLRLQLDEIMKNMFSVSKGVLIRMLAYGLSKASAFTIKKRLPEKSITRYCWRHRTSLTT